MGIRIERVFYGAVPPEPLIIEPEYESEPDEVYTGSSKCGPVTDDDDSHWITEEGGW